MSSISRKKILKELNQAGQPLSLPEVCSLVGATGKNASQQVLSQLNVLIRDGSIIRNRRNRFALSDRMDMVTGRVIGHRDGFGFVEHNGDGADIYLSSREMNRVLHGDKVLVRVKRIDSRGRPEGTVVSLIESGVKNVVGRFRQERSLGFVVPDDSRISQDVIVHPEDQGGARDEQIVTVEITSHPYHDRHLRGRVVEVLGDHMAPGMETEIAIRKHEIPYEWPEDVLDEVQSGEFEASDSDPNRRDLRELPFVTIDGADARDFDDAVYAVQEKTGWRLWVAIADVSHYVKPGSALDRNASVRGNSVYFPGRVIPMLPEQLSNGICSLNPEVDRLAMVCEMAFDKSGDVKDFEFYNASIRSSARLTYELVQEILEETVEHAQLPQKDVLASLRNLEQLHSLLNRQRMQKGSIDLEISEPSFLFDEERKISHIENRSRLDSHRLIEECMLVANVCAAKLIDEHFSAGMYRIHEKPDEERLSDLVRTYGGFGIRIDGANPGSTELMAAVNEARQKRPEIAQTLQMLVLRTMKQAVYSAVPALHFALGFEHYTHFTSPIRRYPDLVVHRLIRQIIASRQARAKSPYPAEILSEVAERCSVTERRAEEATRDVYQWLKTEYMQEHVGEVFEGTISGITQFGVFVTLNDVYVDGLVHISELGKDYFHFDPVRFTLNGERSGQIYRLGDRMTIKVAGVDLDEAKIDFVPVSDGKKKRKSGKWSRVGK